MEASEEGMGDAILKGEVARVVYKMAIQDMPGGTIPLWEYNAQCITDIGPCTGPNFLASVST